VYLGKKSRRNKCCNRVVLGGCFRRVRCSVVPVIKYWHKYWTICDVFLYTVNVQLIYIIKLWLQRFLFPNCTRRTWRYQRGNQNPYIEDEQTTQWLNEKLQKDKQRFTKHTHKTKDRVQQTPLKTRGERRWPGRVSSSCPTSGTRRINLVTNLMISHELGKGQEVLTTRVTYPWSFVTQIFHSGQPSHGGDRKTFEVIMAEKVGIV
jgi:hypothetical protein